MPLIRNYLSTHLDGVRRGDDEGCVAMAVRQGVGGGGASVHWRTRPVRGGHVGRLGCRRRGHVGGGWGVEARRRSGQQGRCGWRGRRGSGMGSARWRAAA